MIIDFIATCAAFTKVGWNEEMDIFSDFKGYVTEDCFFCHNLILLYHNSITSTINFGWSSLYNENFQKYGIPTMVHWFQLKDYGKEWCNEFIGDWDKDLQGCIECPNFTRLGLLGMH